MRTNGTEKKNTTLEMSLDPNYVKNWQVWEAIRELFQNGKDGDDLGFALTVKYDETRKEPTLRITNTGTTIGREALLLGNTSKSERGDQRGCFGEGFKLAWLVLVRNGLSVWCKSGDERWVPKMEHSTAFGTTVLKVDVAPASYENSVIMEVRGLAKTDWEEVQSRLLFAPGRVLSLEEAPGDESGRVLLNEEFRGKLFCRGIYVGRLPENYHFGYDLRNINLDRDRRLADPWDLQYAINSTLIRVIEKNLISAEKIYEILNSDATEARIVASNATYSSSNALSKAVAQVFQAITGSSTAMPIENMAESIEATHHGFKPVTTSKAIRVLVEKEIGTFDSRKNSRGLEAKKIYEAGDLSEVEVGNLIWAVGLLNKVESGFSMSNVRVVDFFSEKINGTATDGGTQIDLAKRLLVERTKVMSTLLHEVAHKYGGDGSHEHMHAIQRIAAEIIATSIK